MLSLSVTYDNQLDVIEAFNSSRRYLDDLEFAISFLKVLNIDFPLILISLNVVERSLLL